MRLGTQTASVINHIQSLEVKGEPKPFVGMAATMLGWTDRYAGTVTKVEEIGGSVRYLYVIEVTRDIVTRVSGSVFDGDIQYTYAPDPNGAVTLFRKNKKTGFWEEAYRDRETGRLKKRDGRGLRLGARDEYFDPSF